MSGAVERSYVSGGAPGNYPLIEASRMPAIGGTTLNGAFTGMTHSGGLGSVSTAFTTTTATIHVASILLPRNLPVSALTCIGTTAGTETGFWQALCTQGMIVRAVSANTAAFTTGFFTQSVLGAASLPYITEYAGLYYYIIGTVSSVAVQVGASAALVSAAAAAGPPIFCGTNATAATVTPPPVGTQLGANTGTAGGLIFGATA